MRTDKTPSNTFPQTEHQAILAARLQEESTRQIEQSLSIEMAKTAAITKSISKKSMPLATTRNNAAKFKSKSAAKAVALPRPTKAIYEVKAQVKSEIINKPVDILPQLTHSEESQRTPTIKTVATIKPATLPEENSYATRHSLVATPEIAIDSSETTTSNFDSELVIARPKSDLSESEVLELMDWALWKDEVEESAKEHLVTEENNDITAKELSGNARELQTDLDILYILNGEIAEASSTSYLGPPLLRTLFEIVELAEPIRERQPMPGYVDPQIIKAEIINNAALEVMLLKTFENKGEPLDFNTIEPSRTEIALDLFEAVVLAINDPPESLEIANNLLDQQEEILKLCYELFTHLDINCSDENISQFIQTIKKNLAEMAQKTKALSPKELSILGTHEHKFGHSFSPAGISKKIQQKLLQQLRLGKYVLRTSVS